MVLPSNQTAIQAAERPIFLVLMSNPVAINLLEDLVFKNTYIALAGLAQWTARQPVD